MLIPKFKYAGPPPQNRIFQKTKGGCLLEIWPRKEAGTILFYPGTMVAPGHYRAFLLAVAEMGLTVAAPHLSGHGLGAAKKGFIFESLLGEGLDAEAWLQKNGYGPVVVCGHSQGGILALAHAGTSRTVKAAFSLCAAFPRMDEAIQLTLFSPLVNYRDMLLELIRTAARIIPGFPVLLPFYLSLNKILSGAREPLFSGGDKGRLSYPLQFLASLFDADIANKINCPYWLFAADNDALFTPELSRAVLERIEAPRKSFIRIPDGGHLFPLNPGMADFTARHIAAACAGLGIPLDGKNHGAQTMRAKTG